MRKKVILAIMDGWGTAKEGESNAISLANTPVFDSLIKTCPNTTIHAEGEYVGLPAGQMGNSEVGHLNIGAGRVVYQDLTRINKSISDGDFFTNKEFLDTIAHVKKNNSALHLMGLVSDGGVHSSMEHLFALIDLAKKNNLEKVYVHTFLDGRDTPPQSAAKYLEQVETKLQEAGLPPVATVSGRYYAMDRDNRWDRVQKAYDCLVSGEGNGENSAVEAVEKSYADGVNDEFILPTIIGENTRLNDGDGIIFFNFRPDRARELTKALTAVAFDGFERKKTLDNIYFVCMKQYDENFNLPLAFPPEKIKNILAEVLADNKIKQLRTAETEKYAHVTFFFNGGVEKSFRGETRKLVSSPKVATYDLQPSMSAFEVAEGVCEAIGEYEFILVNFANPDMVGHTGILKAAIEAIETVDTCIGKIVECAKEKDYAILITADHGNAECMVDKTTNAPFTAHTANVVPFIAVNAGDDKTLKTTGALSDIAPTVLELLKIEQPEEMTGTSLIT